MWRGAPHIDYKKCIGSWEYKRCSGGGTTKLLEDQILCCIFGTLSPKWVTLDSAHHRIVWGKKKTTSVNNIVFIYYLMCQHLMISYILIGSCMQFKISYIFANMIIIYKSKVFQLDSLSCRFLDG